MTSRTIGRTIGVPSLSPGSFPGFGEDAPLDLHGLTDAGAAALVRRFRDRTMGAFTDAAASVHYCTRPIQLAGSSQTVDTRTGEILSSYSSTDAPLGVTLVPCGNRRASECPACARTYARDTFELIRAGAVGGKTVPDTVAVNPMLFVTLTAPSFGHVHRAPKPGQPVVRCRPRDTAKVCEHGRPIGCMASHDASDALVGQPICPDCYDYQGHVVWQWWAPELWRRFTIALSRRLARALGVTETRRRPTKRRPIPPPALCDVASVQYAKVAEYQTRGLIHFHGLIRLDGPKTPNGFAPATESVPVQLLAALVEEAAASVTHTAPSPVPGSRDRVLRFGQQLDVRVVRSAHRPDDEEAHGLAGEDVERVAGYLAKYATKAVSDTTDRQGGHGATWNAHYGRLRAECRRLAAHSELRAREARESGNHDYVDPYVLIGKWAHMLGFRGHFSSKSRRYSVTLGRLRRARRRWQALAAESARTGEPVDTADLERRLMSEDEDETTLVIGDWSYVGTGWQNSGEAALADAAAARAREYAQWRAEHKHRSQNH
ncbi:replication initiator [Terrabacter sp. GCM10028922]|uniref:replication initiator n=1 Tax=Terrabacter sp. GCM10028922 TaxID=3273428 RepID=UPI00361A5DB1